MNSTPFKDQARFMASTGQHTRGATPEQYLLYKNLVEEEVKELGEALMAHEEFVQRTFEDLSDDELDELVRLSAETTKEAIDVLVVVMGLVYSMGINLGSAWKEVYLSNMSKLGEDGTPIRREDGKILKGPNYKEPDMIGVVKRSWGMTDGA